MNTHATNVAQRRQRILELIASIPEGRVATYGGIGRHLGFTPRLVASVLITLTKEESAWVPWFRVVGSGGVISTLKAGKLGRRQIALLRTDGIAITHSQRVAEFEAVLWSPLQ